MSSTHIAWIIAAYLLGAVPFGVVVARTMGGADPRSAGSGNIGATNVGRTLGRKAGLITLACDIAKGLLPTLAAGAVFDGGWAPAAVGLAAFIGHLYPVYLKFKGGKGIATGAGVFLALAPLTLLSSAALFALVVWRYRYVGLGSSVAAATLPVAASLWAEPRPVVVVAVAVALLSIYKHRSNLKRIMEGTEPRLGDKP